MSTALTVTTMKLTLWTSIQSKMNRVRLTEAKSRRKVTSKGKDACTRRKTCPFLILLIERPEYVSQNNARWACIMASECRNTLPFCLLSFLLFPFSLCLAVCLVCLCHPRVSFRPSAMASEYNVRLREGGREKEVGQKAQHRPYSR